MNLYPNHSHCMLPKGKSCILAWSDEEIEKWIVAKVGNGGYLEELVRGYFVILREPYNLQEGHRKGLKDRRNASQDLLDLNATGIRFPAQTYASYQPRPSGITDADSIYKWNRTQLHSWIALQQLQKSLLKSPGAAADGSLNDDLISWVSEIATDDPGERAFTTRQEWIDFAKVLVERPDSVFTLVELTKLENSSDIDEIRKGYGRYISDFRREMMRQHVSDIDMYPEVNRAATELSFIIRSSIANPCERKEWLKEWRRSFPATAADAERDCPPFTASLCPSGVSLLNAELYLGP